MGEIGVRRFGIFRIPLAGRAEFVTALINALEASADFTSLGSRSVSSAYWDGPGGFLGILACEGCRAGPAVGRDAGVVTKLVEVLATE